MNWIKKKISESWNNLGKTFIELTILNKLLNKKNKRRINSRACNNFTNFL